MHAFARAVAVLAALAMTSGAALAQYRPNNSASFQVEHFEPQPMQGINVLGLQASRSLPHLSPSFGFLVHFAKDPLVLARSSDPEEVSLRVIDTQVMGEFWAGIGFFDRLELSLVMPVVFDQTGDAVSTALVPGGRVEGAAAGDMRIMLKGTIVDWKEAGGFGLGLSTTLYAPTGDTESFRGEGDVRVEPRLSMDFRLDGGFLIGVNVAYQARPRRRAQNIVSDDQIRWSAGVSIPPHEAVNIVLNVFGSVQLEEDRDPYISGAKAAESRNTPIEALAGLHFDLPKELVLGVGGGLGLNGSIGAPNYRVYLTFGWTPQGIDTDGDGLRDAVDQCPKRPEDKDGFEDTDGCPDPDNDGDGIEDPQDGCPNDPEDSDGFEDADGCPDDDNDKDGIEDARDKCPNDPEDKDGFEDEDGCPDDDNDKDTILDAQDKCPNEPEDRDGFEDDDGCPDPDNDADGFPDASDKCPNEPETKNGFEDDDGCPDEKPVAKPEPKKPKYKKVRITQTKIEILEKVFFKSGRSTIRERSFALLREVAQVLKDNPAITKLRVEGHTDSKGKRAYNKRLSRARAKAVREFLVEEGIDEARLESEGYGESKPVASNKTRKGRAKNRRVEFTILEVNGKPVGRGGAFVPKKVKDE